jgi:N-acetylmuramoyl-L-alanine amidase
MNKYLTLSLLICVSLIITNLSFTSEIKKLPIRKIVVDPGNGGSDSGPPAYIQGVNAKDINLSIAKKLVKQIQEKAKIEAVLTREDDKYMPLEKRIYIANFNAADLFISIHSNSSKNPDAFGIETYFVNVMLAKKQEYEATSEENTAAPSSKKIDDLEKILFDMIEENKAAESELLAKHIQHSLIEHMSQRYSDIKDRGVKSAPFYLLIGNKIPSVIIETSFISNPRECERLNQDAYQNNIAEAITLGIQKYINARQ